MLTLRCPKRGREDEPLAFDAYSSLAVFVDASTVVDEMCEINTFIEVIVVHGDGGGTLQDGHSTKIVVFVVLAVTFEVGARDGLSATSGLSADKSSRS